MNSDFEINNEGVTVIVPCFNCENTIERAIKSVVDQTRKPSKIILVNDGSTDNTLNVLRKLERQWSEIMEIQIFDLEKNVGVCEARNFALGHALTPWIALLDSDDGWSATKLEKQLEAVKKYKVSFCGTGDNRTSRTFNRVKEPISWVSADDILKKAQFGASSFLFRKNDLRFWSKLIEDSEFAIKYLSVNTSVAIRVNEPLTIYPRDGVNIDGGTGKIFRMTMARHSLLCRYFFSSRGSPFICSTEIVINFLKLPLRSLRKCYLVVTK